MQVYRNFIPKLILIFSITLTGCSDTIGESNNFEDGIYLIIRSGKSEAELKPLSGTEKIITFNQEFIEKSDKSMRFIVIDKNEYSPILLKNKPVTEKQEDNRSKLMLNLSEDAKSSFKNFTEKNLMKRIVIVVGGEALTAHKIKSVIDSGQIQITRCSDNACEMLYYELQDNIQSTK